MKKLTSGLIFIVLIGLSSSYAQEVAILKYKGGGDWYANPTALPNLIRFCNQNAGTKIDEKPGTVEVGSSSIFQYPFLHMTGHGNVVFSEDEAENLRTYLFSGGFLHIDDNYGMAPYLKKALEKVFPEKKLIELDREHPIFNKLFPFPEGLPKYMNMMVSALKPWAYCTKTD